MTPVGAPLVATKPPPVRARLINAREAAAYFGVSERTWRAWRDAGRLPVPVVRFPGIPDRFDLRDLDAAVARAKVGATRKD